MLTIAIIGLGVLGVVIFLIARNARRDNPTAHASRSHAADVLPILMVANAVDTTRPGDGTFADSSGGGGAADSSGGGSDGGGCGVD